MRPVKNRAPTLSRISHQNRLRAMKTIAVINQKPKCFDSLTNGPTSPVYKAMHFGDNTWNTSLEMVLES